MNTILVLACVILSTTTALSIAADALRAARLRRQLLAQRKVLDGMSNSAEQAISRLERAVNDLPAISPDRG